MSTRAIQIEFLLSGLINPTTQVPLDAGTVYFYAAGTTTAKNVWTEKEKTNAYTSMELLTGGLKQLYADGIYKLVVKDSDGSTIYTWDNIRLQYPNYSVVTKTSAYTATIDDDVILVNTASANVTITLHAASTWEHPLIIKNVGANNVVVDGSGAETIDGSTTHTIYGLYSDVTLYSSGSTIYTSQGTNTLTFTNEGLHILDSNASHDLIVKVGSDLTADRKLTITTGDAARTVTLSGNPTLSDWFDQAVKAASSPTFANVISPSMIGQLNRPKFRWKDGDEIYIGAGGYHHSGTSEQFVYWNSEITFVLQSGGSNALSDDYGADGWHYIYLDDSAIVTQAAALLDADCFLNETTAPTWNATKRGWYNGNDRCIFAVYETGGAISEFWHDGENYVSYGAYVAAASGQDVDNTWVEVTSALRMPSFSIRACVYIRVNYGNADDASLFWRPNGSAAAGLHILATDADVLRKSNILDVITDSGHLIQLKHGSADNTNTVNVDVHGWYFSTGI